MSSVQIMEVLIEKATDAATGEDVVKLSPGVAAVPLRWEGSDDPDDRPASAYIGISASSTSVRLHVGTEDDGTLTVLSLDPATLRAFMVLLNIAVGQAASLEGPSEDEDYSHLKPIGDA